jgi:hypothetical protein
MPFTIVSSVDSAGTTGSIPDPLLSGLGERAARMPPGEPWPPPVGDPLPLPEDPPLPLPAGALTPLAGSSRS